jgi:selenocysteine lyase/cysteine desulfurase
MTYDVDALREREFPWAAAGESIYLNHASTGPLPQRALDATASFNHLRAAPHRLTDEYQFATLKRSRELIASLIGADVSEIALATNTTFGINLAAYALPFRTGDVVLAPDLQFPANIYPWMHLAATRGVKFHRVPCVDCVFDVETLLRELELRPRVRAVTVSWVGFSDGSRVDLAALGAVCRERGIYFIVDAIQGLGPLTLDVGATHIDVLACGAQKWLLSPWGSGFVYVRRELVNQLEPHDVSWLAVKGSDDFTQLTNYDLTWRDDARRFEFITLPFQDFAGMNASIELLHELGPAAVEAHITSLANAIVEWACSNRDVTLVTPADVARRAGIVSVRPRDPVAAASRLRAAGIRASLREGAIRLSPHCYNTIPEIERALEILSS